MASRRGNVGWSSLLLTWWFSEIGVVSESAESSSMDEKSKRVSSLREGGPGKALSRLLFPAKTSSLFRWGRRLSAGSRDVAESMTPFSRKEEAAEKEGNDEVVELPGPCPPRIGRPRELIRCRSNHSFSQLAVGKDFFSVGFLVYFFRFIFSFFFSFALV